MKEPETVDTVHTHTHIQFYGIKIGMILLIILYLLAIFTFYKIIIANKPIVFLGDSITEYCDWNSLLNNDHIINKGIHGETTLKIKQRLNDVIENKPYKVFIMMGINDINTDVPNETIIENYREVIRRIKKETPTTKIYVQSILPVNKGIAKWFSADNSRVIEMNNEIMKICKENRLTYINLYDIMRNETGDLNPDYTVDGVHLSEKRI